MSRESIAPTYDHRETGDRFTVETRINDHRLNVTPIRDPFIHHRVVIGWRDLFSFIASRGRSVTVVLGGDPASSAGGLPERKPE